MISNPAILTSSKEMITGNLIPLTTGYNNQITNEIFKNWDYVSISLEETTATSFNTSNYLNTYTIVSAFCSPEKNIGTAVYSNNNYYQVRSVYAAFTYDKEAGSILCKTAYCYFPSNITYRYVCWNK